MAAQERFVQEWSRMSSSWGINRTMAQIHGLLFVSGEALTVDEIMERLQISRGNASMNLRGLMDWGIVRRFRKPGERRDTYLSENDPWQMFARVARERKRRELDPTAAAIRECLAMLPAHSTGPEVRLFRERLEKLLEIFDMLNVLYRQMLMTDQAFNQAIELLRSLKGAEIGDWVANAASSSERKLA
jgi:DNA-binding transcriptional regulator GbsR (MarR family)